MLAQAETKAFLCVEDLRFELRRSDRRRMIEITVDRAGSWS